jgi:hypothetical protein
MRFLKRNELNLVDSQFRDLVLEAWRNKEKVPYGIIHLTSRKPNEVDILKTKQLIKKLNLK